MPIAPPSLCTHPGCGELVPSGRCDLHRKEARREQPGKKRATRQERGYDATWYKFRNTYLLEHPYCVSPTHIGQQIPATDVDHIDGKGTLGERGYDHTNLQALCHSCHSIKTALFDGSFGKRPKGVDMPWSPMQKCATPDCPNLVGTGWCNSCQEKNLSETNITVVAGPPCSGKTTYVEQNKGPADLVIDLDALAYALGAPSTHERHPALLPFIFEARDAVLKRMMKPHDIPHVWVIRTAPKNKERREWWQANVIVIETPKDICLQRAKDNRPPHFPNLIEDWWNTYETNPADTIVKG